MKNYTKRVKNKLKEKAEWECKMKINPIGLGSYNSQYKGQNPNDSQNFKDSSQDSKKRQNFLDIMRETNTQQKEINNDSTNAISTNSATTPILTPTNPYGSGNGGNYRYNMGTQGQSPNVSEVRGSNATTHNGGFTQLLGEKDERNKDKSRRSGSIRTASLGFRRIYKQTNLTREEKERLNELEKNKIKYAIKAYKQHENRKKTIKQNLEIGMGGFV